MTSSTTNTSVQSFTHLKDRPKADQALPLLQRIASLVKPIMRKHGWVLPVLSEFFPESPNLVGLNINGGEKILLRLRPAHAPDTFYDEENIVHTMLHELTHNVHGPHDDKFYNFLAGLEDEYAALKRSGYVGEGFFSKGNRLGTNVSHNLPPHLARQRAVEAAEKRRWVSGVLDGGGRLGGTRTNKSPRQLAAEAAERRARDEKACASGTTAQREAERAAKQSVEDKVIDLTVDYDSDVEIVDLPYSSAGPSRIAVSAPKRPRRSPSVSTAEWSCPQCTLINEAHKLRCAVCECPRPSRPAVVEWPCPQCTLMNDPATSRCAVCEFPRLNESLKRSSIEGWTCSVCGEAGMPHDFWSCQFCGSIKTQS